MPSATMRSKVLKYAHWLVASSKVVATQASSVEQMSTQLLKLAGIMVA